MNETKLVISNLDFYFLVAKTNGCLGAIFNTLCFVVKNKWMFRYSFQNFEFGCKKMNGRLSARTAKTLHFHLTSSCFVATNQIFCGNMKDLEWLV